MNETNKNNKSKQEPVEQQRREFVYLATGAFAAVGGAAVAMAINQSNESFG